MTEVVVTYHRDGDVWWAESDDLPGLSAVGSDFEEVEQLVQAALVEYFDDPGAVKLLGRLEDGAMLMGSAMLTFGPSTVAPNLVMASRAASWGGLAIEAHPPPMRELAGTR